jgi:hypothetical protein
MALTDELSRLMGFDQGPDNNAEVNIKIKPLGSVGAGAQQNAFAPVPSEPSAGTGTSGIGGTSAPSTVAPPATPPTGSETAASSYFGNGETAVPVGQRVQKTNPTLVTHPLGAQTDDIYEAAVAQLQFDTQRQYASLLQELGFMDESGSFIPGTLETGATRQRTELQRQRELQLQQVVENAVRGGTVFSGRRAKLQAQAQELTLQRISPVILPIVIRVLAIQLVSLSLVVRDCWQKQPNGSVRVLKLAQVMVVLLVMVTSLLLLMLIHMAPQR